MRMWMVNPKFLCRKHLSGEYSEVFKHRHNFVKKHSMTGRIFPTVLIEPTSMKTRVEQLRAEGLSRGYNYKAQYEMPDISYLPKEERNAKVDVNESIRELKRRCPDCAKRIEEYGV